MKLTTPLQHRPIPHPRLLPPHLHRHRHSNDNTPRNHRRRPPQRPKPQPPRKWLQRTCQDVLLLVRHRRLRAAHHLRDRYRDASTHSRGAAERAGLRPGASVGRAVFEEECGGDQEDPGSFSVLWVS